MVVISTGLDLKKCAACGHSRLLSNYHRKGLYLESRCKLCVSNTKRKKYLLQKKIKPKIFSNIIIKPYALNMVSKRSDVLMELESFLIEEFSGEQRIRC